MDLITLAQQSVQWLAPVLPLLAMEAGKELAKQGVKEAWELIKGKLQTRGDGKAAERFQLSPENPDTQVGLRLALEEALEQDPEFVTRLKELLPITIQHAAQSVVGGVGVIQNQGNGNNNSIILSDSTITLPGSNV